MPINSGKATGYTQNVLFCNFNSATIFLCYFFCKSRLFLRWFNLWILIINISCVCMYVWSVGFGSYCNVKLLSSFGCRLFQFYRKQICQKCNKTPNDPTLCLTCGAFLCFRSNCCTNVQGIHECVQVYHCYSANSVDRSGWGSFGRKSQGSVMLKCEIIPKMF